MDMMFEADPAFTHMFLSRLILKAVLICFPITDSEDFLYHTEYQYCEESEENPNITQPSVSRVVILSWPLDKDSNFAIAGLKSQL